MNKQSLFGIENSHLISLPSGQRLHREMASAFEELKVSASVSGFDLAIASGFRDFDRQLKIWNGKYLGLRPIYDDENRELDVSQLSDLEKIQSILKQASQVGMMTAYHNYLITSLVIRPERPTIYGHH